MRGGSSAQTESTASRGHAVAVVTAVVTVSALLAATWVLTKRNARTGEVPPEPAAGNPEDKLVLVSFPRPPHSDSVLSMTPFGGKVEAVLRMAGLEFEGVVGDVQNKNHAPKGKLPTLVHGPNKVADSSVIFAYLANTYPEQMEVFQQESLQQSALALALQRMLEEDLYFCALYGAWLREDAVRLMKRSAPFAGMPRWLQPFMVDFIHGMFVKALHAQGIGRHSWAHVQQRMAEEVKAVASLLDGRQFLLGSRPCQADCFLFAILEFALHDYTSPESSGEPSNSRFVLRKLIQQQPALLTFHARLRKELFPENSTAMWASRYTGA